MQASISESSQVPGDDNVLTVLLAVTEFNTTGDEVEIEYPHGLPAGVVVISGLYWPLNWPDSTQGSKQTIPVVGYRSAAYGFYDGKSLRVNLTDRPQACLEYLLQCSY
jgi:hypothetical protein